jgi:hypothetical protein
LLRYIVSGLNRRIALAIITVSIVLFALVILYLVFFYAPTSLVVKASNLYANNWSGYAVVSSSSTVASSDFDSISASWTVPEVGASPAPGYSSVWIGIGGLLEKSNRLIQVGTEQDIRSDGSKDYYAWFEVLPRPTVNVGSVSPGDLINARISRVDGTRSTWHAILSRESNRITTTLIDKDVTIRTNSASTKSAEFIVEAPAIVSERRAASGSLLLPLANFGTGTFTHCATNLGELGSLTNLYRLVMTSDGTKDGTILASPSTISEGGSSNNSNGFSVNRLG